MHLSSDNTSAKDEKLEIVIEEVTKACKDNCINILVGDFNFDVRKFGDLVTLDTPQIGSQPTGGSIGCRIDRVPQWALDGSSQGLMNCITTGPSNSVNKKYYMGFVNLSPSISVRRVWALPKFIVFWGRHRTEKSDCKWKQPARSENRVYCDFPLFVTGGFACPYSRFRGSRLRP